MDGLTHIKQLLNLLCIVYYLAGWDIGSAFFGVGKKSDFKRMIQGALKF